MNRTGNSPNSTPSNKKIAPKPDPQNRGIFLGEQETKNFVHQTLVHLIRQKYWMLFQEPAPGTIKPE
jgi:hypothetical protein